MPQPTNQRNGMMKRLFIVVLSLSLLPVLFVTRAAGPGAINYQGQILEASGVSLTTGNYTIEFALYDDASAGNLLWGPVTNTVAVVDGAFNVVLGPVDSDGKTLLEATVNAPVYIEITVDNNPPVVPRQRMLSAPFALHSDRALDAGQLAGYGWDAVFNNGNPSTGRIPGSLVADHSIAALQLADASLTVIAGSGLTGGGTVSLGGTTSLSVSPNSLTVNAGSGLTGGGSVPLGGSTTLAVSPNSLTVNAGSGLTGGGSVSLGGSTTLSVSPNWVRVNSGSGLTGGGTISLGGTRTLSVSGVNNSMLANDAASLAKVSGGAMVASGGRLGIGISSPRCPLDVDINTYRYEQFRAYVNSGGVNTGDWNLNYPYAIRANGYILAWQYNAISDQRIKQILGRSDPRTDLELVRQLQVTDYRHIDTLANGAETKKGFIAQEVRQVVPEAVSATANFIPSIYALATSAEVNLGQKTLVLTLTEPHGLTVGDQVRLYTSNHVVERTVTGIPSERQFVVSDWDEDVDLGVFVYGKYVTDYLTLDYDRLFTAGIGAIQELAKQVEAKEARISDLEADVARLRLVLDTQHEDIEGWTMELQMLKTMVRELNERRP